MKVNRVCAAILSVSLPVSALALGMGELIVESYLNQPFKAEIPLLDVDDIPLAGIKATLASPEDFERIGLDRNEILSFITFEVKNNARGKPVIALSSTERITEPYLQMVVDLAWAQGQLYRSYTILLDPPGYKLISQVIQTGKQVKMSKYKEPGVVEKQVYTHVVEVPDAAKQVREEATYGPTLANENIWQIAQHYSTGDTTLPQIILAIVGTNSQAFTQGNLNGLKIGERLRIPSNEEVLKVPADLAQQEVDAHDTAWKTGKEIKHVLLPPYIDGVMGTSQFEAQQQINANPITTSSLLPVPLFKQELTTNSSNLYTAMLPKPEVFTSGLPAEQNNSSLLVNTSTPQADLTIKAAVDVNTAAINTIRSENLVLKKQIDNLEKTNKQLIEKLDAQNKAVSDLRLQITQLIQQRQSIGSQVISEGETNPLSFWWIYLILLAGGISLGTLIGMVLLRRKEPVSVVSSAVVKQESIEPAVEHKDPFVASPSSFEHLRQVQREESKPLSVANIEGETSPVMYEEKIEPQTLSSNTEEKIEPEVSSFIQQQNNKPESTLVTGEEKTSDFSSVIQKENEENQVQSSFAPQASAAERSLNEDKTAGNEESVAEPGEVPALNIPAEAPLATIKPDFAKKETVETVVPGADSQKEAEHDNLVEFEPGLHKSLFNPMEKRPQRTTFEDDRKIEYIQPELPENIQANPPKPEHEPYESTSSEARFEPDEPTQPTPEIYESSPQEEPVPPQNSAAEENFFASMESEDYSAPEFNDLKSEATRAEEEQESPESAIASEEKPPSQLQDEKKLIKSKTALDTLLALAKTYISMDDIPAARQSLQEVIEFGNEEQKTMAQELLKSIENKK